MNKSNITSYFIISVLILSALSFTQNNVFAANPTDLGTAKNYAILSGSVITNDVTGQAVTGNTGHVSTLTHNFTYTGLPSGSDHFGAAVGTTSTPGTPLGDEHTVLLNIGTVGTNGTFANSTSGMGCDFAFANGAIDLSTDITHGTTGVYTPGVYCIFGAPSIGTAGITLNGAGTYIFKSSGSLTTVTGSNITLSGGAQPSNVNVFWAPSDASLGANTSFLGTILSGAGAITLGANSNLDQGRFISESAVTIGGGANIITVPGGVVLASIAIQTHAIKTSYSVGDSLNTTGLVVIGTLSNSTTMVVTPNSITGFDSSNAATGQVLTIHVGASTTTYTINVVARPVVSLPLGTASNYAILSGSVITNGFPGQPVTGDTGHFSTLTHNFTYIGFPPGTDHRGTEVGSIFSLGTPLGDEHALLNSIGTWDGTTNTGFACDFRFANGAIDLAADTTHGPIGVYAPGVYCIDGAPTIGTAGITLNGVGTYVFKSSGQLLSATGSTVRLSGGALASNVVWAPVGGASLAASTSFQGTILSGPAGITLGAASNLDQGRFISESAVTIGGGANIITVPGGITLTSIAITTPATKLSYSVGDSLDTTGLVVTATLSDSTTVVVTPDSITGFNSASPVFGSQILTIHVGARTTTYTIHVLAAPPSPSVDMGTASNYAILSGNSAGNIVNGVHNQLISVGNVGHTSTESDNFTFTSGFGDISSAIILGNTATLGTPIGDAHAIRGNIGTVGTNGTFANSASGMACTFSFANGAIDLGSNVQFPSKVYPPGVYCIDGAVNIGSGPITLTGNGLHIFKINGTLDQTATTNVVLSNGALSSNVFWVPKGATTLGANDNFIGTILAGSAAITTGANDNVIGRLVSESTVTIGGGANTFSIPTALTLSSITITTPATKLSYTVGDLLNTAGLVVNGTLSDSTTTIVTPDSITGFDSTSPVFGQVLTIHVGAITTTYKINILSSGPLSSLNLGTANSYVILSGSVITNNVPGQAVTGDTGHVSTLSAPFSYVGFPLGTDHASAGQVGFISSPGTPLGDEHSILVNIGTVSFNGSKSISTSGLDCTFAFAKGAIDLATDTTHGTKGVYTPGVYCIFGAPSIGTAGITLSGPGTYVFKSSGSLTSVTQSRVTLSNGALASNVFWAPAGGASLGATTSFQGTILSGAAAITLGANSTVNHGRLISESAVTILDGGTHTIAAPGGVALSSITITHPATKLSYIVGDSLNTTGLVVTATYTDVSTSIVAPDSITGFNSTHTATNQVLTIHVGASTTAYTINVLAGPPTPPSASINLGTSSTYALLAGNSGGVITNGVPSQPISRGNVGYSGSTTDIFTFAPGFGAVHNSTLGTTTTLGTPIGDAYAALGTIGTYIGTINTGMACTYTHQGAIDLAIDTTHGHVGQWAPGVYCINGAITDTTPGAVNFNGTGLHVFKSNGQLTTPANAFITFNGASGGSNANAGNLYFAPIGGASLGATNQFSGTILANSSAIILGANMNATNARFISTSAITVGGITNIFSIPSVIVSDTTAPTVVISSPTDGSIINQNNFTISGTASDNISVDHVIVTVNGVSVPVTGTTSWSANSTVQLNGAHTVTATSFDAAGNSASQMIHVTTNTVVINSPSASITSSTGTGPITSITDHGHFVTFTPVSESTLTPVGKPVGETFPYGFMSFNVTGLTNGQIIHITETYPGPIPANAKYWKIENGVWTDSTSLISISGNTVTITLTDGGSGDADLVANGSISDPGGLGFPPLVTITLGSTSTFSILASTYTNTAPGVVLNGDLGYTTGPAVLPIIFGTTYVAPNLVYSQAGVDEGIALPALNALSCNHSFGGITNLSLLPQPLVPGVYCIASAMSVGTGGITLNGAGTYVFRSTGALDTAASSHMTLTGGADAANVYWAPGAATTLGANSNFVGTDIDDSGITIGANVAMNGRALAFGGTVLTDADTFAIPPTTPVVPLQFSMPSGSNSPSESRPSLGGVELQTFSDGLRINGHVFDVSKFHNPVPQQVLPLDKPVSITIKQGLTRGSQTWQHVMLFMNFGGKDTTTGNADTWMSIDKRDGVQVNDPNGFVTNVGIRNEFAAYGMNTTFTFTPVKQMTDSNMIIRVWDNRLSQTDANVDGAIVFGSVPTVAAPMVKPDWIQVFTTMSDADNVIENAGFVKPALFSHISTTGQVWTQPNTGHILWFYDSKDLQVARVIYDSNGNVMGETVEPLINSTSVTDAKDMSYAGNHLNRQNNDEMKQALAQQASNAAQTIERLGYSR